MHHCRLPGADSLRFFASFELTSIGNLRSLTFLFWQIALNMQICTDWQIAYINYPNFFFIWLNQVKPIWAVTFSGHRPILGFCPIGLIGRSII